MNEAAKTFGNAEVSAPKFDFGKENQYIKKVFSTANKRIAELKEKLGEALQAGEFSGSSLNEYQQKILNASESVELLQKKWQELSAAGPVEEVSGKFAEIKEKILAAADSVMKLKKDFESLKKADISPETAFRFEADTSDLGLLELHLESIMQKEDALQEKLRELNRLNSEFSEADVGGEQWSKTLRLIAETQEQLGKLQKSAEQTRAKIAELSSQPQEESILSDETVAKIDKAVNAIHAPFVKIGEFVGRLGEKIDGFFGKITLPIRKAGAVISQFSAKLFAPLGESFGKLKESASAALTSLKGGFSRLGGFVSKGFSAAVSATSRAFELLKISAQRSANRIKSLFSGAFSLIKSVGAKSVDSLKSKFTALVSPVKRVGNYLKSAFKRTFITTPLFQAARAIRSYFSEVTAANEQFSDSLNAVKANLSIAFAPIMQAIMPALNAMMSGLATASRQLAGFISGLFGTTYKQAADAAQKLRKTADEAKKAKLSIAGIDEMNVLSADKEKDSDDEKGIDFSKLDMSEPQLPDWAERLKTAIRSGDWYGVGKILAERVNAVFGAINWEKVRDKVVRGVKKVTDAINGFVDGLDWRRLGESLGNGVNTAFAAMYAFYDGIDWKRLGGGIADGLNGMVETIDWFLIGRAFGAKINAILDVAYEIVTKFNWNNLGKSLADCVNSLFEIVDFTKAGAALSGAFTGVLDTITSFLDELDGELIRQKIADFTDNIDFSGIAERVGGLFIRLCDVVSGGINALAEIVEKFYDRIDWNRLGIDIAIGLNRAVAKIDFAKQGRNIGKKMQAIIDVIYAVVTKFNWSGLGAKLGDSVNSLFSAVDYGKAGAALSNALKGLLDLLTKFIEQTDWRQIGQKIADFIGNIDFVGIAERFFKLLGAAFGAAASLLSGLFAGVVESIRQYFTEQFEKWDTGNLGLNIVLGLFSGILEALADVGRWIYDNVLTPFVDGFKAAFDIHSPSKVMAELGGYIIDGLLGAIADGISTVTAKFTEMRDKIKGVFDKIHTWFRDKFGSAYKLLTGKFSGIKSFFSGKRGEIEAQFEDSDSWFESKFGDARSKLEGKFSDIGSWFSKRREEINGKFADVGSWFESNFGSARTSVEDKFNDVGDWFGDKWNSIQSVFDGESGTESKFGEWFGKARGKVDESFEKVGGWFSDRWNDIKNVFGNEENGTEKEFGDWFDSARTKVESAFSGVADWFESKWNEVKNVFFGSKGAESFFGDIFGKAWGKVTAIFDGISGYFDGIWENVSRATRIGVNKLVYGLNQIVHKVEDMLNFVIDGLNSALSIDVPNSVPVIGGTHFDLNIPRVELPWIDEIPECAVGGLATAPTLAMVGDNKNASVDPEVIAPLSKLEGMLGVGEIVSILRTIVELIKVENNVEIVNYLCKEQPELERMILRIVRDDSVRRGG